MNLSQKHCIPCLRDATALVPDDVRLMLGSLTGWSTSDDGKWLQKSYKFKNFALALAFTNQVGGLAETENHHPDILLGWGYVTIRLQTHAVDGLHENDFILAAKIDKIQ